MNNIDAIRSDYMNLHREIIALGNALKSADNSPFDSIDDQGDIFVRNLEMTDETGQSLSITGNLCYDRESGRLSRLDLEKVSEDETVRYMYEQKENNKETLLKKTDTLKQKAEVENEGGTGRKVKLEQIRFVESALSPDVEKRSNSLKEKVLSSGMAVARLDETAWDLSPEKDTISVKMADIASPDGTSRHLTGSVVWNPQTNSCASISLLASDNHGNEEKHIYTAGSDFDYFKIQRDTGMESAQIFDKGGPALILFQEENIFRI